MPRKPSNSMFGTFQSAQNDVMGDLCNIQRVTLATGTYSDDESYITTGTYSVPCGFYFTNGAITVKGQVTFVDYDVVLRIPFEETIQMQDKVELVSKGNHFVSGTFSPFQAPEIGATATIVRLKRIV